MSNKILSYLCIKVGIIPVPLEYIDVLQRKASACSQLSRITSRTKDERKLGNIEGKLQAYRKVVKDLNKYNK